MGKTSREAQVERMLRAKSKNGSSNFKIVLLLGFSFFVYLVLTRDGGHDDILEIDLQTIYSDYRVNEVAANNKYKGEKIKISGRVLSIKSGLNDKPFIVVRETKTRKRKNFSFVNSNDQKQQLSKLVKQDSISFTCTITGEILSVPQFNHCEML